LARGESITAAAEQSAPNDFFLFHPHKKNTKGYFFVFSLKIDDFLQIKRQILTSHLKNKIYIVISCQSSWNL
jgi:hypothetical protein